MKCFTVNYSAEVLEGIGVAESPYPHVPVGESGRGRTLVRFPVARNFFETLGDEKVVHRASVLKTREKGTLLLVEELDNEDRRALVLLEIYGGYRGEGEYTSTQFDMEPCWMRGGKVYSVFDRDGNCCARCGAELSKEGDEWVHPDSGEIRMYRPLEDVALVLAEGRFAEGAAGRVSDWPALLVIMKPGTVIRYRRTGRTHGAPHVLYIHYDGARLAVGEWDVLFPPSEEMLVGDLI